MSETKRKVPKLRFPGFTEDWEQRKLGEVATFSKGNGYSKSDLVSDGQPIILYGRLYTNYETTINKVDTFVELKDNSVISQGGEVIVPATGETAEDISRAAVIENQGIIIGGDLNVIRVKELLNPTFLALTISNGEQQKELSKRAQGKSVVHLHNSDLQEVNLVFPTLNEQKEISSFFEKLDDAITLHQRKLENLKLKKKALLQKLFPKNGEQFPELRFPGFTDAWEQRKFGEVFEYERPDAYIVKSDNYSDEYDMPVLTANKAFVLGYTEEKNSYDSPSIIFDDFTLDRKFVDFPYMLKSSAIKILTAKTGNDLRFLFERLNSTRFEVLGHARHYISVVQNTDTLYPNFDEQTCISKFLENFDNLITLHQRKLEHLQLQKKALLQQMFV